VIPSAPDVDVECTTHKGTSATTIVSRVLLPSNDDKTVVSFRKENSPAFDDLKPLQTSQ